MAGRHSARGVDKEPGWIERGFRELRTEIAALRVGKISAVPGSVVTIQQILTDPTSPIGWVNDDAITVTATGNQTLLLSQTPIMFSDQILWNGLGLDSSQWTRAGRVVTITDPGCRVDDVFSAAPYPYDSIAAANPDTGAATYLELVASLDPLWFARINEASGTTMTDFSGNERAGTYGDVTLGAASLIASLADTSGTFGSTSSAEGVVTHDTWMNLATIGLVGWIRPDDATTVNPQSILDRDNLVTGRSWQFRLNSSGQLEFLFWTNASGPHTCTGSTALSDDTTAMVGASFNGTTAKVFVNGVVDGTLAQAGTLMNTGTANLSVGVSRSATGGAMAAWFDGEIQAPAVFTSLSDNDFANLYAAGVG